MTERARRQSDSGSRERLVTAATSLLARQGYEATTVNGIAAEGAAPMGSFYFHFPGGKEALGVAALHRGAQLFATRLAQILDEHEALPEALAACADWLAAALAESEWADGCPIAATALESVTRSPALRTTSAEGFALWIDVIRRRAIAAGVHDGAAIELATNALALLEGAEMLSRAQASPVPLQHAASALRSLASEATPLASAREQVRWNPPSAQRRKR